MPLTLAAARMTNRGLLKLVDNGGAHEAAVARHENLRQFVGDAYEFQGNSNVCFVDLYLKRYGF
jgi:hypothetical protein